MYYGLEQPVEAPKVAIWDMQPMMQYISLLKDRYDKAQEKMDKFAEKYGALSSQLPIDNAKLKGMVGGLYQKISDMENNGIDPYRSAEGIGTINRLIREANSAEFANMQASAKRYEEFEKSKAKAIQNGTYNEALERGLFNGKLAREWNTAKDGIFPVVAMPEMKSLTELTDNVYKQFAPQELLKRGDQDPDLKKKFGNESRFYNILGVSDANKAKALAAAKQAVDNTMYGKIYRQQAAEQFQDQFAMLSKVDPRKAASMTTAQKQAAIDKIYGDMIEAAQSQHLQPKLEKNQIGLDMWKESQANWRTERAHRGDGDKPSKPTYSLLRHSVNNNLDRIIGNTKVKFGYRTKTKDGKSYKEKYPINNFAQAQSAIVKRAQGHKDRVKYIIDQLSGTYNSAGFYNFLGRDALNGDGSSVEMNENDLAKLYTREQLVANAWGVDNKGQAPTRRLHDAIRKDIVTGRKADKQYGIRMTATGKVLNIMDKTGDVHTYREVYIPKKNRYMYYDVEYTYHSNDNGKLTADAVKNVGAEQADANEGILYKITADADQILPGE